MARRAGKAVAGFEKASIWLKKPTARPGLLLEAADGAPGGKRKMQRLTRDVPVVNWLSATELGSAMGSDRTVHLVIESGGLADGILKDARRLEKFRKVNADKVIGKDGMR